MRNLEEIVADKDAATRRQMKLDVASQKYPSVPIRTGHRLHICRNDGYWVAWLNTEVADFDGLCLATGSTRDVAVARAVAVLEAALEELQKPAR